MVLNFYFSDIVGLFCGIFGFIGWVIEGKYNGLFVVVIYQGQDFFCEGICNSGSIQGKVKIKLICENVIIIV